MRAFSLISAVAVLIRVTLKCVFTAGGSFVHSPLSTSNNVSLLKQTRVRGAEKFGPRRRLPVEDFGEGECIVSEGSWAE